MSRRTDREQLVAQLARELPERSLYQVVELARKLSRAGATLQRYAELECSSEWHMNKDRVPCPRAKAEREYATKPIAVATRAFARFPCLCDYAGAHGTVPRITVQGARLEQRITKLLAEYGMRPIFGGDPRGPVLKVIPPSYAERNAGRDEFNLEGIYVA